MDYEEKYKDLVKRLNKAREEKGVYTFNSVLDAVAPELKESEDERIRKYLLVDFKLRLKGAEEQDLAGCSRQKDIETYKLIISWLEKQGEQKQELLTKEKALKNSPFVEQKPVDKVEPKFKVGEWVIDKQGIVHQIAKVIENVTNHTYGYDIVGGGYFNDNKEGVRPWTIQGAKDGDVLYCKSDCGIEYIVMSKGVNNYNNIDSYFRYNSVDGFDIDIPHVLSAKKDNITPATQEQRDLLFQKMHESGYEWDAEKKELKKIEQKPTEWSEEDDMVLNSILDSIQREGVLEKKRKTDWLKSLKKRYTWKPSDEQMKALSIAMCGVEDPLFSLYQDLKKLKE